VTARDAATPLPRILDAIPMDATKWRDGVAGDGFRSRAKELREHASRLRELLLLSTT
jgi:hypothetical protein